MPSDIVDLNDYQVDEWPSTPEGEERQKNEWAQMYRILFEHPLVEALTLGILNYKDMIVDLLKDILKNDGIVIKGVYERSDATKNAIKGYREINIQGLKLVKDGGYFATCSCSHFMTQELFTKTVKEAAKSAHKRLRQIEFKTQSPDHPILWAADESYYLKFYIFQVVEEK